MQPGPGFEKGIASPAGTNNPWNLGKYTQLTTKLFQYTPFLLKAFQKKADFIGGEQGSLSSAQLHVPDDSDNETNRRTKPVVVVVTPILRKGSLAT